MGAVRRIQPREQHDTYDKIRSIDGRHDIKDRAPGCYVAYQARYRKGGRIAYFNFALAKEMGLIPKDHPHRITAALEKALLDTFAITIINEHDIINGTEIPAAEIKPHTYMATRYLQLQHPNKAGVTSGDGRSLWNGQHQHRGSMWDITSCGTGATCLSPATAINKKFYKTGDPSVSYGCGYAEISEGIGNAIFSEIFHRNGIKSERMLCVIGFPKGLAINVRAGKNLIRPSHLFNHLKQGQLARLKSMVDLFIERQVRNGDFPAIRQAEQRYQYLLFYIAQTFAQICARFERDYIFCWLDWDGDNILCDGGIIDYGSIRQFGLFHHEYRFDDVERWSTKITEQKLKSRYTLQTFAQLCDFLLSGKKRPVEAFRRHPILKEFETMFKREKSRLLLEKVGYTADQITSLMQKHYKHVRQFEREFDHFERVTSTRGPLKIEDGITTNAVFCMRDGLRELPHKLHTNGMQTVAPSDFMQMLRSSYATRKDLALSTYRRIKIAKFQRTYMKLVDASAHLHSQAPAAILRQLCERSKVINRYDRITGDAMIHIANAVVKKMPDLSASQLQTLLEDFIEQQVFQPEQKPKFIRLVPKRSPDHEKLFKRLTQMVKLYREGL